MKYMLLIYLDEQALSESEREQCYEESTQFAQDLDARGLYLGAAPLHPTATATSVRVRDGKRLVTDGPFAETREQFGGYFLVDAKDLEPPVGRVGCEQDVMVRGEREGADLASLEEAVRRRRGCCAGR